MTITHFYMVPFTGLGLFNGYRGDKWLKNRIEIFKRFVLPSIQAQGSEYIHLWFCWRPEEKTNPIVQEFQKSLEQIRYLNSIHTFGGIPFYDDKYEDSVARTRLLKTLEVSLPELELVLSDTDVVLMTIQPSDDMYLNDSRIRIFRKAKELAESGDIHSSVGFRKGYIMCYNKKEIAEYMSDGWQVDEVSAYRTDTIPPFFTVIFPKETFLDPQKHFAWIGPYKSHEDIADVLKYNELEGRGFIVGTHGNNISTIYNHRYRGRILDEKEAEEIFTMTGIFNAEPIKFKPSKRFILRKVVGKLPAQGQLKKIYYSLPIRYRKL